VVTGQGQRLSRLIQRDLLLLARLDDLRQLRRAAVSLAQIARDLVEETSEGGGGGRRGSATWWWCRRL